MKAFGLRNANTNTIAERVLPRKAGIVAKQQQLQQQQRTHHTDENVKQVVKTKEIDAQKVTDENCRQTSLWELYEQVGDVDAGSRDARNVQMVPQYAKEIFSYLLQLETLHSQIRQDHLRSPVKLVITPRMRKILFDWLVQVHSRLSLQSETLYLTMQLIDRYMSSSYGASVGKADFQLLGISAMFLASKYEEVYAPSVHDFVYLTDNAYSESQVLETERSLLSCVDFFLGHPLPIQFLRRYSKVAGATQAVHEMAKYLAEAGSCAYSLAHLPASAVAASAFCLSCELMASGANSPAGWCPVLEVYSGYSKSQLVPSIRLLAEAVVADQAEVKYKAVRKKYGGSGCLMVSRSPELSQDNPILRQYIG